MRLQQYKTVDGVRANDNAWAVKPLVRAFSNGLLGIKLSFSFIVLALGVVIVIGSFVIADQMRFSITKGVQSLYVLRYQLEYATQHQHLSSLAAVGNLFSSSLSASSSSTPDALGVPVLTYHSVLMNKKDTPELEELTSSFEGANVSLGNFKDQMFALKSAGWQAVSYEDFEAFMRGEKSLPEKSFLLTFDDGAKDSFYPVDPILAALGYHAAAFILPEHSLGDRSTYYLNKKDLQYMLSTGRWAIESHGQDVHTSLPVTADGTVKENALSNRLWLLRANRLETHDEYAIRIANDLAESKNNLEDAFGIDVSAFAFPFGDYGQNKSNDPQAESTILAATKKSYSLAFYQNWSKEDFIFNYPSAGAFMVKRIAVNPTWSGEDLLEKLEASSPKALPYKDDLRTNNGWQNGWGLMGLTDRGLRLAAAASTTGSLALLDGSYTWDDYTVEMPIEWSAGYAILLFDMQNDREGRACVFGTDGLVQLQDRTGDDILIRRETRSKDVSGGEHTIGAVTNGTTTACLFDGKYVIDATLPALSGGVGVEAWAPEPGEAEVFIKSTSAYKSE